ncbi:hypothetical protein C1645_813546 [Glomus cerebriforme]|uniref:Uncharacterized protein n=1 Tax=Glomus cerebriforme TaxID=658196 RepID=A0A397THX0_9GLOM|nr:hypothetical protein C1645_813546 [Glomus cerebriforme]
MILTLAAILLALSGDLSFDFNFFLDCSVDEGLVIDRDCWNGEEDTEGVLFHILIRGDDDEVVVILDRGDDDIILGRGGVDEFLSVESVKGIWPIEAKISASTKSLKGSEVHGVLGLDVGWDDIDKDVGESGLLRGVLGLDEG